MPEAPARHHGGVEYLGEALFRKRKTLRCQSGVKAQSFGVPHHGQLLTAIAEQARKQCHSLQFPRDHCDRAGVWPSDPEPVLLCKGSTDLDAATTAGNWQALEAWCQRPCSELKELRRWELSLDGHYEELEQLQWLRSFASREFLEEAAWRLWPPSQERNLTGVC